jgi:hypothetical protein
MAARTVTDPGGHAATAAVSCWASGRRHSSVTGSQLLALHLGLRARGLRGLDVLRRSRDRAPPTGS